jgi:hypothetical protein
MAQLEKAFDSGQHDDMNDGFKPIPAADYLAKIVESDYLVNSKKTGKYLKLKFEILKGEFKGRFIWTNLNLENPSQVTVEIAQKELATLCRACGKSVIQDSQEIHGIPITMKVKIKPAKGDYPAGNEPAGYSPAGVIGKGGDPSEETDGKIAAENFINESDDVPWPED